MSVVEVYCDPSIGGFSGSGTIGDPYTQIQWAVNNTTIPGTGTFSTRLNIKSGALHSLGSELQNLPSTISTRPFIIEGYDSVAGDGGRAQINCGGAFIDQTNQDHIHIANLDIFCDTADHAIHLDRNCSIHNCYIQQDGNGGLMYIDNGTTVSDCYLVDTRVAGFRPGIQAQSSSNVKVMNCVIDYMGNSYLTQDVDAYGCVGIIRSTLGTGFRLGNKGVAIGNIVANVNAGPNTNHGISLQNQDGTFVVKDNYIEGFDGGAAIHVQSSKPSSVLMVNNHYHNCGDAVDQTSGPWSYGFSTHFAEPTLHASSLLTDSAGGDYSLNEASIRDGFVNPGGADVMSLYTMRHLFDDTFGGGGGGGGGSTTTDASVRFVRLK